MFKNIILDTNRRQQSLNMKNEIQDSTASFQKDVSEDLTIKKKKIQVVNAKHAINIY